MLSVKHMLNAKHSQAFLDFALTPRYGLSHMAKGKDKDPSAVSLGKRGGKARTEKLSPERRKEIAQKAARIRWSRRGSKG